MPTINSRIQCKHDVEENWNKAINFIPKAGEIIIFDKDEVYDYVRIKIGDGITNINLLNFLKIIEDTTELITVEDIDEICGASIVAANEVTY